MGKEHKSKKSSSKEDGDKEKKRKERKNHDSSSKRKQEVESLERDEHKQEAKRLRRYENGEFETSKTDTNGHEEPKNQRRRTRSFDMKEEAAVIPATESELSVSEWRRLHSITIRSHSRNTIGKDGNEFAAPYREFRETPFSPNILQLFDRAGFSRPTAIQSQAWPIAIQGHDMICIAKTGSGKTCGFLLPYFHQHIEKQQNKQNSQRPPTGGSRPTMLVMAPTRELSVQIQEEATKFGGPIRIRSLCCYGGASKYPQIQALQRGSIDCLIATPGRLNDLLEMKKVDLSNIGFLVLDEADRMLDMGFEPQIRSIVDRIPSSRQTLLFSATWPKEIQTLAHDFLKDPIQINVGEVNALVANKDIEQKIIVLKNDDEKFDKLKSLLRELCGEPDAKSLSSTSEPVAKDHEKIIVFVARKVSCDELANSLWNEGFLVDSLHGDRPQWERTKVMNAFKIGKQLRMLIATDVAARGLDVKDVGVVINYDMPVGAKTAVEDYIHRIGRTGRAGAKGKAYTLFTVADGQRCATQLVQVLTKADQQIPPELQALVGRRNGGSRGGRGYSGGRSGGRFGGSHYGGGGGGGRFSGRGGRGMGRGSGR